MKSEETWKYIHEERVRLVETLASLSPEQWAANSWCKGWSVKDTASHVLAGAEQTTFNFFRAFIGAGMKFDVCAERGVRDLASLEPGELVRRLKARTTTTNRPPAPVMVMLGEIVVHGDDIRRPLGLTHRSPEAALFAVADNWKNSNLLIGAKRRIFGLRLRATDADWSHGDGPEVAGPMQSLILAMVGRPGAYGDLSGDGVSMLKTRP